MAGTEEKFKTDEEIERERAESILTAKKDLLSVVNDDLKKDATAGQTGLYELRSVVTHQGSSADSGHYHRLCQEGLHHRGRSRMGNGGGSTTIRCRRLRARRSRRWPVVERRTVLSSCCTELSGFLKSRSRDGVWKGREHRRSATGGSKSANGAASCA